MGSIIAKQPNGLYCRFSFVVDCITDYDMTEEEYIELCAERGRKEAKRVLKNYVRPFSQVVKHTHPVNMKVEKIIELFKKMGYDPTADEILRWRKW